MEANAIGDNGKHQKDATEKLPTFQHFALVQAKVCEVGGLS
jgi:hypothetical protein